MPRGRRRIQDIPQDVSGTTEVSEVSTRVGRRPSEEITEAVKAKMEAELNRELKPTEELNLRYLVEEILRYLDK